LQKDKLHKTTSGQRKRGRQSTLQEDNITKWTGIEGDILLRSYEDNNLRMMVHEAVSSRIEDAQDKKKNSLKCGENHRINL